MIRFSKGLEINSRKCLLEKFFCLFKSKVFFYIYILLKMARKGYICSIFPIQLKLSKFFESKLHTFRTGTNFVRNSREKSLFPNFLTTLYRWASLKFSVWRSRIEYFLMIYQKLKKKPVKYYINLLPKVILFYWNLWHFVTPKQI